MPDSPAEFVGKLSRLTGDLSGPRTVNAAGMAAKKATIAVARKVSGGDQRLSGWGRRGVKLGVGYDVAGSQTITLNLRPKGVWTVMERGRRGGAVIRPKRRRRTASGRPTALLTPAGPRASSHVGRMAPKKAVSDAEKRARADAVKAAKAEVRRMMSEVFR